MSPPPAHEVGLGDVIHQWWEQIALALTILAAAVRVWWHKAVTQPRADRARMAALLDEVLAEQKAAKLEAAELRADVAELAQRVDTRLSGLSQKLETKVEHLTTRIDDALIDAIRRSID